MAEAPLENADGTAAALGDHRPAQAVPPGLEPGEREAHAAGALLAAHHADGLAARGAVDDARHALRVALGRRPELELVH